jgi:hypothetical protein
MCTTVERDKRTRHTASQGAAAEVSSVSCTRRVEGRGLRYTTVRLCSYISLDASACRSLVVCYQPRWPAWK